MYSLVGLRLSDSMSINFRAQSSVAANSIACLRSSVMGNSALGCGRGGNISLQQRRERCLASAAEKYCCEAALEFHLPTTPLRTLSSPTNPKITLFFGPAELVVLEVEGDLFGVEGRDPEIPSDAGQGVRAWPLDELYFAVEILVA